MDTWTADVSPCFAPRDQSYHYRSDAEVFGQLRVVGSLGRSFSQRDHVVLDQFRCWVLRTLASASELLFRNAKPTTENSYPLWL